MRLRLRPRTALELPVIPNGVARELALVDARHNGQLAAQARTRKAVRAGLEAWVGLLSADEHTREDTYALVNADGVLLRVHVTIAVEPAAGLRAVKA